MKIVKEANSSTKVSSVSTKSLKATNNIENSSHDAILDRSKINDRKTIVILVEAVKCFGQNLTEFIKKRYSVWLRRLQQRCETARFFKNGLFNDLPFNVHWFDELMQDLIVNSMLISISSLYQTVEFYTYYCMYVCAACTVVE